MDSKESISCLSTASISAKACSALISNDTSSPISSISFGIRNKGDAFWTYSSGLAGIIAASAGNDLYHPIQAMFIAAAGVVFMFTLNNWVERRYKIDDAVGAVAVHGYAVFSQL